MRKSLSVPLEPKFVDLFAPFLVCLFIFGARSHILKSQRKIWNVSEACHARKLLRTYFVMISDVGYWVYFENFCWLLLGSLAFKCLQPWLPVTHYGGC